MNWVLVIEEYNFFLIALHCSMKDKTQGAGNEEICYKYLIGALASHLNCILLLVKSGFDVQARAFARIISEHIDVMLLLFLNETRCEEFMAAEDPKEANRFWHRNIARGRARKAIRHALPKATPEVHEAFEEMRRYYQEEEEIWSSVIHPSFLASVMSCCMGVSHGAGGPLSLVGVVDSASIRTLSFVFYKLFELFLVGRKVFSNCIIASTDDAENMRDSIADRLEFLLKLSVHIAINRKNLPLNACV